MSQKAEEFGFSGLEKKEQSLTFTHDLLNRSGNI